MICEYDSGPLQSCCCFWCCCDAGGAYDCIRPEVGASTAYAAVVPVGQVVATRCHRLLTAVEMIVVVIGRGPTLRYCYCFRCLAGGGCPELLDIATSHSSVAVESADGQYGDVCKQLRIRRAPCLEGVEGLQAVDPLGATPQAPDDAGLLVEGHCIVLAALPHLVQEAHRPLRGAHQEDRSPSSASSPHSCPPL